MANGLAETAKDPILEQMIQAIEAKLDPQMKDDYQRIVVAGMHFMFDPRTHKYFTQALEAAKKDSRLSAHVIEGIAKLIGIIANESKGQMNVAASFPAAITLMCKALEYIEAQTGAKISKESLAQLVHALIVRLMKLFKIDQNKLAQGLDYAKANQGKGVPGQPAIPPDPPQAEAPVEPMPPGAAPPAVPNYERGVAVVPRTGPAIVHRGEQIVPKSMNPNLMPVTPVGEEMMPASVRERALRRLRARRGEQI